jgi:hypothetical protein
MDALKLIINIEKFAFQTCILTNEQLGKLTRVILWQATHHVDDKQIAQLLGQDKILLEVFDRYKKESI